MSPLYASTLYQGLYQVYATRAPLGFIQGRRGDHRLPLVGSVRNRGAPTAGGISVKSPQGPASPDPPVVGSVGSAPEAGLPRLLLLTHEFNSSRLLYDGLCRGIVLLYAGAMLHS